MLGRCNGYDYVHTAIDDHTRLAHSEFIGDGKDRTCAGSYTARWPGSLEALRSGEPEDEAAVEAGAVGEVAVVRLLTRSRCYSMPVSPG